MCLYPIKMQSQGQYAKNKPLQKGFVGDVYNSNFLADCGHCLECIVKKRTAWQVKSYYEDLVNPAKETIVLTYADENLPPDGLGVYEDFQEFMRSFRDVTGATVRYFCFMDYDDKMRPHFHVILFGKKMSRDRRSWKMSKGRQVYRCSSLESLWNKGMVFVEDVHGLQRLMQYLFSHHAEYDYCPDTGMSSLERVLWGKIYSQYDTPEEKAQNIALIKQTMRKVRPRYESSLSFGWAGFIAHLDDYMSLGHVSINNFPYNVSREWVDKLALTHLEEAKKLRFEAECKMSKKTLEQRMKEAVARRIPTYTKAKLKALNETNNPS